MSECCIDALRRWLEILGSGDGLRRAAPDADAARRHDCARGGDRPLGARQAERPDAPERHPDPLVPGDPDGLAGILRAETPHLVLLDLMLPRRA